MTTAWRTRIAALRAGIEGTASADGSCDRGVPPPAAPNGSIGANGTGGRSAGRAAASDAAAFFLLAAEAAAAALAAEDPDFADERREMAAALAAEARGDFGGAAPWTNTTAR